jgi:hypothetical protein
MIAESSQSGMNDSCNKAKKFLDIVSPPFLSERSIVFRGHLDVMNGDVTE